MNEPEATMSVPAQKPDAEPKEQSVEDDALEEQSRRTLLGGLQVSHQPHVVPAAQGPVSF